MIGCLRTRVHKQPIIALYFESELVLNFYNLEARGEMTWGLTSRVRTGLGAKRHVFASNKKGDML